jgi:hypothetical protein
LSGKLLLGRCLVSKVLLLLTASAVVILLLAPAATAQDYVHSWGSKASVTAIVNATEVARKPLQPCSRQQKPTKRPSLATSYSPVTLALVRQPCFRYLKQTGGPSLVAPLALGALVILVGSSVVMRTNLRE